MSYSFGYGFEKLREVQTKAIISILKRKDVIAISPPATGKTMSYIIALLKLIDPEIQRCQALIVSENKEIARFIHNLFLKLGENLRVSVGNQTRVSAEVEKEMEEAQENCQVLVSTLEAASDMIKKGCLKISDVDTIVIDDIDKMLKEEGSEKLNEILDSTDEYAQIVLFSSIMTPEIIRLSEKFLEDPAKIVVREDELTLDWIKQYYIDVEKEKWRNETLKELIENLGIEIDINQCTVYCKSVARAIELEAWVKQQGLPVISIHEDMDRDQQEQNGSSYRRGYYRILIITELVPTDFDISGIKLSIFYDPPTSKERYLKLTGRKGRFGRMGVTILFVTKDDMEYLKEIEQFYSTEISELPLDVISLKIKI